jgi:site-specific DNA recombinase
MMDRGAEAQIRNLRIAHEQVSERLRRLTDAYLDGTIERDLFEERKASLLFERQAVTERVRDYAEKRSSIPDELQKYIELAGDTYSLYKIATPEKKRRIVEMVTSNFSCHEKTLEFAMKDLF